MGWTPTCRVEDLIKEMIDFDKKTLEKESFFKKQSL